MHCTIELPASRDRCSVARVSLASSASLWLARSRSAFVRRSSSSRSASRRCNLCTSSCASVDGCTADPEPKKSAKPTRIEPSSTPLSLDWKQENIQNGQASGTLYPLLVSTVELLGSGQFIIPNHRTAKTGATAIQQSNVDGLVTNAHNIIMA